jgi:hypothetical protein
MNNFPICLENLGSQGRTNVNCWSEVATEHRVVIRECYWLITKYDLVMKSEFIELADVGFFT